MVVLRKCSTAGFQDASLKRAQAPEQQEPSIVSDSGPESPKSATRSPPSPWKTGVRESPRPATQRVPSSTKSDESCSRREQQDIQEEVSLPMEGTVLDSQTALRRSTRIRKPNPKYTEASYADTVTLSQCCASQDQKVEEPSSFEEAKGIPEWENAMKEEISALKKNETWELVPLPEGVKPI